MAKSPVGRILRLQMQLILGAVLLGAILSRGSTSVCVAILLGGFIAWIPAFAYSRVAFAHRHVPPGQLLLAHFKAEAVKIALTALLFGAVLMCFNGLSVAGLFGGYIASASAYWLGLLNKIEK
nr:ATP synthase subunit I [Paludibacterium yongneupense]